MATKIIGSLFWAIAAPIILLAIVQSVGETADHFFIDDRATSAYTDDH